MTKNAVAKSWENLTASGGRLYSDPANEPGVGGDGPFLFEDDFDYVVNTGGATTNFTGTGPWDAVNSGIGEGGDIYTTTTFPSYAFAPPGGGRWCRVDARPDLFPPASIDIYLQTGAETDPLEYAVYPPYNVMQFVFIHNGGDWDDQSKFIYANASTDFGNEGPGLVIIGRGPYMEDPTDVPADHVRFGMRPGYIGGYGANNTLADVGAGFAVDMLYQNMNAMSIPPNVPYLVRFEFNTTTNNTGHRMWLKPVGSGSLTLCFEWVVGTTASFLYDPSPNAQLGPGKYRIPTVMDSTTALEFAIANFRIAESTAAMPVY